MMNFVLAWRVQRIKRTKWNLLSGHLNTGWRERWLFHLIIQLPSHRSSEFTQHEGRLLDWQIIICFEASAPPGGPALMYRDNNNNYLNDYWKRRVKDRWRVLEALIWSCGFSKRQAFCTSSGWCSGLTARFKPAEMTTCVRICAFVKERRRVCVCTFGGWKYFTDVTCLHFSCMCVFKLEKLLNLFTCIFKHDFKSC